MSNYTESNKGMVLVLQSVMAVVAVNDKYVCWFDQEDAGGQGMWITHRWVNMAGTLSLLYGTYHTDKDSAIEKFNERSL